MDAANRWTVSGPCVSRAVRGRIRLLMLLLAVLMLTPLIIMRLWNWYTDYFQIYTHRVVRMQHSLDPYPCAELKLSKPTDPDSCPAIVRRHLYTPPLTTADGGGERGGDLLGGPGKVVWAVFTTRCSNPKVSRLIRSLEHLGLEAGKEMVVLGVGMEYRGLSMKIGFLHDYLREVHEETLVIFTDADDVLMLPGCSLDTIREKFKARHSQAPIVYSAERDTWKSMDTTADAQLLENYRAVPPWVAASGRNTSSFFLNSGLVVGFAGFLRRFMRMAYVQECVNDQVSIRDHFVANVSYSLDSSGHLKLGHGLPKDLIELDYHQDLLCNLFRVSISEFEVNRDAGRLKLKETGGEPCILHQSGCKGDGCSGDFNALEDIAEAFKLSINGKDEDGT